MSKSAWKNHAYTAKKFINGKWRYFYGNAVAGVKKLGADAKMNAVRASDAARRGASKIIKDVKNRAKLANADARIAFGKTKLGRRIYTEANIKKNAAREKANGGLPVGFSRHKYTVDYNRFLKKDTGHIGNSRLKPGDLNAIIGADKNFGKGYRAYLKANRSAAAAQKKGKSQTEYYKNLGKVTNTKKYKEAKRRRFLNEGFRDEDWLKLKAADKKRAESNAAKAKKIRKQADLDRMTSVSKSAVNKTKREAEQRRKDALDTMTSVSKSAVTAGRDRRIAANNKAIAANKKGKSQTEYYKNLQKKQAAKKAAKKQADLDRMTSTSKSDASIFSNTPRRPGYLDLGIDKKGIHYRLNMGKKGKKKTKKGSRSGFSWSYK